MICVFAFAGSAIAAPPAAPTNFIFSLSTANNLASFEWVDNASDETGFEFEVTIGDGTPFNLNGPAANITTYTFSGFTPGSPVTFRLRAVKSLAGGAGELEVSEWTPPVEVITKNLSLRTLVVTETVGNDFSFLLADNTEFETFEVVSALPVWLQFDSETLICTAENPTEGTWLLNVTGSEGIHTRALSLSLTIVPKRNFLSSAVTGTPGQNFDYTLEKDFECDSVAIIGSLPVWLSFDTETLVFSAVNPPVGSIRVDFEATIGPDMKLGFLHFNIINEGPTILAPPAPLVLLDEALVEIDLDAIFEDPDFIRAAAVVTEFGDLTIGFYDGFPVTVGNFFAYAENDAWDGAFFHRMAKLGNGENFVLQGGGFKPDSDPGTYTRVTQLPAIVNEFDSSRPNLAGTISMAKLPGNPNSATNQFFISLNDNRAILDGQNGGFTVFGRTADISPANRIATLARGEFNVPLDDFKVTLGDWPLTQFSGGSPASDQLASMNDVFEIPTLSYSFSSDGNDIVVAEVAPTVGAPLVITRSGMAGSNQLTITASDLDGAEISTTLSITVMINYDVWAGRESASGPDESSDAGALTNFEEYAYGGDPNDASDDQGLIPTGGLDEGGYGTLTFYHRDFADDLSYRVETSTDFLNWSSVWETGDGFEDENISSVVDEGELKLISVRSDDLIVGQPTLFFRLVVSSED